MPASAPDASGPARLARLASRWLAVVWLAAPLVYLLWVLPPSDAPPADTDLARMLLAIRVGPLLLALGEAARAGSAFMLVAAGDARHRALGHVGLITTGVLVAMAITPGPWLGLLALGVLAARHAAAAQLLGEPVSWASAAAFIGFGAACELGGEGLVLGGLMAAGAIAAIAELGHALRLTPREPRPHSSSGGSGAS